MTSAFLSLLLAMSAIGQDVAVETDYWTVEHYVNPEGQILEIGGIDFLPDGRMVASTRRGQVWIIENPLDEDITRARFHLAAEGLNEGLGLKVVDEDVYIVQRGELSRLRDLDGDSVFETIDTITQDWGLTGNYHEFAFGLPRDDEGNFYVSLNVGFWNPDWWHGKSRSPWRGWVLRIAPDGTVTPVASGVRSPCGLGIDVEGRLLVTDNQGDWMAACPILHVRDGDFFGHPASLRWTDGFETSDELSSTQPPGVERTPPALWIPYAWSRSTGNLEPDTTGGAFGPFEDQLFVAELTNGMIIRAQLEEVEGVTQGACMKFMQRIGSACRVVFAPDGSLIAGFTNRGWGGFPPGHGLARIRYTGVEPMEIDRIGIQPDGFDITFTQPVEAEDIGTGSVQMTAYDYNYWWDYGSPEQNVRDVPVTRTSISPDRRTLSITAPIEAGSCVRIQLKGIQGPGGLPLLHDEVSYTINRVPGGGDPGIQVAREVELPASRDDREEGWLRLNWGDAFEQWESSGWVIGEAELDADDRTRFTTRPGNAAIVNTGDAPSDFVTRGVYDTFQLQMKFMLPEQGRSGVRLPGGAMIELKDNSHLPGYPATCGALVLGDGERVEPATNAYQGSGLWHELTATIEGATLGENGEVLEPGRAIQVAIDGTVIHGDVELRAPTGTGKGPVAIAGDLGLVGFADVRIKPQYSFDVTRWTSIMPGTNLEGWHVLPSQDAPNWSFSDSLLRGRTGGAFLTDDDGYRDLDLLARVRVNDGGRAVMLLRAPLDDPMKGYPTTINSTEWEYPRSGSVGTAHIRTDLLAPNQFMDVLVTCRTTSRGVELRGYLNGVLVSESIDTDNQRESGAIGFVILDPDTRLDIEGVWIRPANVD
ncbi:MAG: hypothetical protein CMJ36_05075 [Phycisphaerae bacterium]|nr:hypothetical protein [Phycisphaerae bacterium]